MDFETVVYTRRAVRAYTDEPVAEPVLRKLIDAAIQAPSAVNEQPWIFAVVRDREVLKRISDAAKSHILARPPPGVSLPHLHEAVENADFDVLYDAPALIVVCSATQSHWAVENCSLAAENLMLAARAARLGSCWIGFAQVWLATPEGKATINVPATCVPVAPIIVGHPSADPPPVPRKAANIVWVG
jgi:nitroreductase